MQGAPCLVGQRNDPGPSGDKAAQELDGAERGDPRTVRKRQGAASTVLDVVRGRTWRVAVPCPEDTLSSVQAQGPQRWGGGLGHRGHIRWQWKQGMGVGSKP